MPKRESCFFARFSALFAMVASLTTAACSSDEGKPSNPIIPIEAGAPEGGDGGTEAGGKKGPAEDCTGNDECQSGVCFIGGRASWCSYGCTAQTAATVCVPVPPFDGTCNNQGFCRRPN